LNFWEGVLVMELFKSISFDTRLPDIPITIELIDAFTSAPLLTRSFPPPKSEYRHPLPGTMTWRVRVWAGGKLLYEENPYQIAPPEKMSAKMWMPTCGIVMNRDGSKINVMQIWEGVPVSKVSKVHHKGTVVLRYGGLGDLIMLTSSLLAYKEKYPRKKLYLATLPIHVPIFKPLPFLSGCVALSSLHYSSYDEYLDMRAVVEPPSIAEGRTSWEKYTTMDRSDIFDEAMGVYPAKKRFTIPVNDLDVRRMKGYFDPWTKKIIGINVSVPAPIRSIIPEYIEPLCRLLLADPDVTVALFGQTTGYNEFLRDVKGEGIINVVDKTTVGEMVGLVSIVDLSITGDTGSLHIAGALGKRCLGLFGNINPRTRTTYYSTVKTIFPIGELPCIPCWDGPNRCQDAKDLRSMCMGLITPERIMSKIKEMGGRG
jgi:ADP-heptose:LPS heptosyltransferase